MCLKRNLNKYLFIALTTVSISNNLSAQNSKSGYSDVNGIKMYYEIHGLAQNKDYEIPLVLIHGGGSTIESSFGQILPFLAKNHQVIAVELQAHGHTGDRDAPESFEQDADDVAALLQNLKITKSSILGFSNGGNTAIQIYVRHPEIVDKLILASTFYKRDGLIPGLFDGMQKASLDNMPQSLKDAFLKINPDSSKLLTMFNKDKDRMLDFKDWKDETISSIKAPTLIINGDEDVVQTIHALDMSKLIPNSRLMILPSVHGGYLGAVDFDPNKNIKMIEMTAEIINEFLTEE